MTSYRVLLTEEAADDLLRIEDFTIDRELASETPDLDEVTPEPLWLTPITLAYLESFPAVP